MLRQIPVTELRLGMYVQKLDVSWLKNPFMSKGFLLTNAGDLLEIQRCGASQVWIDPAKSRSLAGEKLEPGKTESKSPAVEAPKANRTRPATQARTGGTGLPLSTELKRARAVCDSAKTQVTQFFADARLGKAIDPAAVMPVVDDIAASVQRHHHAIISVARLKQHDTYTYLHSVAVCALMLSLSKELGLDPEQTRLAGVGGLMHDVGKAAMPLDVLNKPGRLTDEEYAVMKRHPAAGASLLERSNAEPVAVDIALHHHEKFDGSGYPQGLKGDEISLLSRMAAICDVYDAVTSERVYKKPWEPATAIRTMASWEGHFDKAIFQAFVKTVGIYPVGSLVRLSSQQLAVVTEPGAESLLKPTVRIFYSVRKRSQIRIQTLDLAADDCSDSIEGPEDPATWGLEKLESLWL